MTGRRKLLLADDSPTIQKVISLTFADEGMEVVTASDGREALRRLEDGPAPDILLADAVMPGPDGYELCARVKRDGRLSHVPVVLLVGTFEPFNEAEARRVGADAVLTKPFQSIRDLVNKVGSLIGGDSKQETEERRPPAREEEGHRELAAEVQTRAADREEPEPEPVATAAGPETSFADLEADDELIEARPAEAFGGAPSASHAFSELDEEPLSGEPVFEPREAPAPPALSAAAPSFDAPAAAPAHAAESVARPAFEARAAATTTMADDALLDLGQNESPASAAADADADEFVLDLDDDFPPLSTAAPSPAAESAGPLSFADLGDARPDAPSALAEAAHWGGPRPAETEAARTPFEFSSVPSEAETKDAVLVSEVVSQEPPPAAPAESEAPEARAQAASAPGLAREFIEPRVVPAGEASAARDEFTDGSVEGDVPKPPPFIPDVPAPPAPFVPETPSTAGFAVGEARTGVEEREERPARDVSPAQLSPETIDAIARRVVELMSDRAVREIAWEVVPDLAELIIKRRLDEERGK